jgi:hypothetical protein
MPPSCGTVTWLSSTISSAFSGMYSNRLAGVAAGEVARVVLDAVADADRLQHLQVVGGALLQPLRLQQKPVAHELLDAPLQLRLDARDRLLQRRPRRHVVAVRVDGDAVERRRLLAGERIDLPDRLDLVAEQREFPRPVLQVRGEDLDDVARRAEEAAGEA